MLSPYWRERCGVCHAPFSEFPPVSVRPDQPYRRARLQPNAALAQQRLRAEFIAGAEEEWRKRTGRPMTAEELKRVLRRYPGDI